MSKTVFEQYAAGGFTRRSVSMAATADPAGGGGNDPLGNTGPGAVDVPPPTPFAVGSPGKGEGGQPPAVRPPHMPPSPSPEDKYGARNALTRERGGMPTKNRLPPPTLGATMGHGQGVPYCGQQSPPTTSFTGGLPPALTASETLKVQDPRQLQAMLD